MNRKFDSLDKKVKNLRNDNKVLKKQNTKLVDQVSELTSTVVNLETRVKEAEKKNENLEAQSRRDNLKFYGIEDDRRETWEQTELKTRNYLTTQLDINESNIQIERTHRLPSRSNPRPVIVKFSHLKDKERVLKAYRDKRKNQQIVPNAGEPDIEGGDRNKRPDLQKKSVSLHMLWVLKRTVSVRLFLSDQNICLARLQYQDDV